MNQTEWGPIAAFIENVWKDEFDPTREEAYAIALKHLNSETVMKAVVALSGNRSLANVPVSAAGTYLPSAQTIAIETAAWDQIGTWQWAETIISAWIVEHQADYSANHGTSRLPDDYFVAERRNELGRAALAAHGTREQAEKVVAYVDSWGLRYLCVHRGGTHYVRQARRRWAELTLSLDGGSALMRLPS